MLTIAAKKQYLISLQEANNPKSTNQNNNNSKAEQQNTNNSEAKDTTT